MKFDLIIPCFNPSMGWETKFANHLGHLIELLAETKFNGFQVILINDGSIQNFQQIEIDAIQKIGIPILFIENNKNYGKGYSLRRALEFANSPFSIYTDLDFPFGTESIIKMLKNLEKGYDIVLGARSSIEYYSRATFGRRIMSKSLMLLNKYLLRLPFEDTQAGIKGFNQLGKKIFLSTTINRFLFDLEFIKIACSYPEINIHSISVVNDKSMILSSFSFKTVMIEFVNFIRILLKHNYFSRTKIITWNRFESI